MSFNLELPDVEEVKEKVAEELAVTDERQQTVDETAKQKVEEIMGTDISVFEDRKNLTTAFEEFGADVMRKTENKNSILSKRMGELSKAGSESGEVAKGLQELAEQMKSLDPSLVDFDQKGLFGKISNPFAFDSAADILQKQGAEREDCHGQCPRPVSVQRHRE